VTRRCVEGTSQTATMVNVVVEGQAQRKIPSFDRVVESWEDFDFMPTRLFGARWSCYVRENFHHVKIQRMTLDGIS